MSEKRVLALVALLLVAFAGSGQRPALAQVAGTLNQWTAIGMIEQLETGDVQALVEFDDNGSGGTRRGGTCLVTDLGLGRCTTNEACSGKAVDRGLPGTGTAGWWHYCVAAATDEGVPGRQKRCWSRPGTPAEYCSMGVNSPGAVRTRAHTPYGIEGLDDDSRDWTAIACLAGGTAPDGTTVGDPLACALLTSALDGTPLYLYVIDTPLEIVKRNGR